MKREYRIGFGAIYMPKPVPRGKPDNKIIHMYRKQNRPGLNESFSPLGDYPPDVLCKNGNYHLWMVGDPNLVTCPKCLEQIHQPPKDFEDYGYDLHTDYSES